MAATETGLPAIFEPGKRKRDTNCSHAHILQVEKRNREGTKITKAHEELSFVQSCFVRLREPSCLRGFVVFVSARRGTW